MADITNTEMVGIVREFRQVLKECKLSRWEDFLCASGGAIRGSFPVRQYFSGRFQEYTVHFCCKVCGQPKFANLGSHFKQKRDDAHQWYVRGYEEILEAVLDEVLNRHGYKLVSSKVEGWSEPIGFYAKTMHLYGGWEKGMVSAVKRKEAV